MGGRAVSDPRRYVILIEPTNDGGYGAWAPDLPVGTLPETRSAIAFHLEGLQEDGLPIPEPTVTSTIVEVAAA